MIMSIDQKMKVFDAILRKVRDEGPGDVVPERVWAEELTTDIEAALVNVNNPLPPMAKQLRAAAKPREPAS